MAGSARRRVLFVGEASTMAHVARPLAAAAALPPDRFEVVYAFPESCAQWVPSGARWHALKTQPSSRFYARMATGRPLFDRALLERYVAEDHALIAEVKPDVIVGDGRLSLGASAREAGVPYLMICNAFYDSSRPLDAVMPCLRWTGALPEPVLEALAAVFAAPAYLWHALPMARMLAAHGVRGVGWDPRRIWCAADGLLYADIPEVFPEVQPSPSARFIGPLLWDPPWPAPKWWDRLPADRPLAYLSLGSSGDIRRLPELAGWLAGLGYTVMASTAARIRMEGDRQRIFTAKFLPGSAACARADLVVCNGGALTVAQALTAGKPVLAVGANLDQLAQMKAIVRAGAGVVLRSDHLSRRRLARAVEALKAPSYAEAAQRLQRAAAGFDTRAALAEAIDAAARRAPEPAIASTSRTPAPFVPEAGAVT